MHYLRILPVCLTFVLAAGINTLAEDVYQKPREFVKEAFAGEIPTAKILRVTGERRAQAARILGHPPHMLRTRYWRKAERTAWVLEEIGKTKPITAGFIVDGGRLQDARILIYRESHGAEVRHSFFTRQFKGAALATDTKLDTSIDGISGATLSVSAIRRLATLALYFDKESKVQ